MDEEQDLHFTIDIIHAHFTTPGRYFLTLHITGTKVIRSKVKVFVNNSTQELRGNEFSTDVCLEDGNPKTTSTFKDSSIAFWMPAECANGDIELSIEAFRLPEDPMQEGEKCGDAVFDVFPRRGALFSGVRHKTPPTKDSNQLYKFETQFLLSQVLDSEGFSASSGVITATVALKYEEPKAKVSSLLLVREQQEAGSLANFCPSSVESSELHSREGESSTSTCKNQDQIIRDKQGKEQEETAVCKDSLFIRQQKAGSLANFCPTCEFSESRFVVPESKLVYARKKRRMKEDRITEEEVIPVCRDSLVIRQLKAGSLANLCPSCEFAQGKARVIRVDPCCLKKKGRQGRGRAATEEQILHVWNRSRERSSVSQSDGSTNSHILTQEQAGSLANFYPSFQLSSPEMRETVEIAQCSYHGRGRYRYVDEEENELGNAHQVLVLQEGHHFDSSTPVNVQGPVQKKDDGVERRREKEISHLSTVERTKQNTIHKEGDTSLGVFEKREYAEPGKTSGLPSHLTADPEPGPSHVGMIRTIAESPLEPLASGVHVRHLCGSYTAREGYCEVAVLVHGALGLPFKSDWRPPQPYITGKSGRDISEMRNAKTVSHAAIQPTHSPSWEELLLIEVKEEDSNDEVITLQVADHPSRELLTEYSIPLGHIKPFHQYHLETVQPNSELSGDVRLYITIVKKMDRLPIPDADSKMYGLEVLLRGVASPVTSQMGPLVATGRIVTDWREYRETMLSSQPRQAGVTVTTIHFPSPHPTSFAVAGVEHVFGSPVVTVAGEPQEQPQWNQTMFFAGDSSALFTSTSALVLEYYPAALAMSEEGWQLRSPIGYSYQTLDQLLLSSLQWDNGRLGLRLDNLPVEGSQLKTALGTAPAVNMLVRLVTSERPDQLLSAAHVSSLPAFRTGPHTSQPIQPGPSQPPHGNKQPQQAEQTHYGLPPMDAVKNILPHFHTLYNTPRAEPVPDYVPLATLSSPADKQDVGPSESLGEGVQLIPQEIRGTLDIRSLTVLDYQMKEVDRYRTAMRKMATDLLHVREDCKRLEQANSRLRRDLGQHDEISRLMVSSKDLDNVTHSELVQKFVLLKKKLADESTKKQEIQTRLQRLQNDLIKKNDMEKEFLLLQEAHEGQQGLLQKLQRQVQKTKTIQETCKKQEKVIVKLEQLLGEQGKGQFNGVSAGNSGTYLSLSEENAKLQAEVLHLKELLRASEASKKDSTSRTTEGKTANGPLSDIERLELYGKLEKAEGRILALEKQLADNLRKWAKEKTDLQVKLNEQLVMKTTGYKESLASIDSLDWTGPKPPSPSRSFGPRRPSPKLDPLERR